MKRLIVGCLAIAAMVSCQENDSVKSDFTGNQTTYPLSPGSPYNINGTVTFKEKKDGTAVVTLKLTGTEGNAEHPVHLHLGNIATDGAAVAALLNPVEGSTGESETALKTLADESSITYAQLLKLDACIKVHLAAAGPDKDIILAGGNIGKAAADNTGGRLRFAICQ